MLINLNSMSPYPWPRMHVKQLVTARLFSLGICIELLFIQAIFLFICLFFFSHSVSLYLLLFFFWFQKVLLWENWCMSNILHSKELSEDVKVSCTLVDCMVSLYLTWVIPSSFIFHGLLFSSWTYCCVLIILLYVKLFCHSFQIKIERLQDITEL